MIKCPSCHKGTLRRDYGQDIECSECSVVFKVKGKKVRCIPSAAAKTTAPKIAPEVRRGLFFDRLVLGESPQQISDALKKESVIISPATIQNYRENHAEEISQRRGQLASLKVRQGKAG
jgi:transcription initiation factor TFIIIB Brf1 subunit/transcription initiation factor TFIIB